MNQFKSQFIKLLSIATYPGLEENKKLAIQIATFEGFWTLLTILFYFIYTCYNNYYPLYHFHFAGILLECLGIWVLYKRHYDLGRAIIHLTVLAEIFITSDALGPNSGSEFYYFANLTIPFVTFSIEERKKGLILTSIAVAALIFQQIAGTGLFLPLMKPSEIDRLLYIIVVVIFMFAVMSVARWQMALIQNEIKRQQAELIHNSNLAALGEMSGGIAHEINNPLQTLSLHNESIRRYLEKSEDLPDKIKQQLSVIEKTISKISIMIKGLKELSRDVSHDPIQLFYMKEVLDEVMSVSSERLKHLGIRINVSNDNKIRVKGQKVHVSQVLINLLNNSIDALDKVDEKVICLDIKDEKDYVVLSVQDTGPGIPKEIAQKIFQPFFTTKDPGKGTGLGLSISKSIIEKSGGRFYFDTTSAQTRFVIELPIEV